MKKPKPTPKPVKMISGADIARQLAERAAKGEKIVIVPLLNR